MDRPIFANYIWCACYKKHWARCKKFVIISLHGFWVFYCLIKIKLSESSPAILIIHDADLENKFAVNPLLKDNSED